MGSGTTRTCFYCSHHICIVLHCSPLFPLCFHCSIRLLKDRRDGRKVRQIQEEVTTKHKYVTWHGGDTVQRLDGKEARGDALTRRRTSDRAQAAKFRQACGLPFVGLQHRRLPQCRRVSFRRLSPSLETWQGHCATTARTGLMEAQLTWRHDERD